RLAQDAALLAIVQALHLIAPRGADRVRADRHLVELAEIRRVGLDVDGRAVAHIDVARRLRHALRADEPAHLVRELVGLLFAAIERVLSLERRDVRVEVGELRLALARACGCFVGALLRLAGLVLPPGLQPDADCGDPDRGAYRHERITIPPGRASITASTTSITTGFFESSRIVA